MIADNEELKVCAEELAGQVVVEAFRSNGDWGESRSFVKGMRDQMLVEHRTHQQDVIRVLTKFIQSYKDADHDLRNAAAVALCGKLDEIIDANPLPRY